MATTPNHGIVYPVVGNTITPLATHFANLANSTDSAIVNAVAPVSAFARRGVQDSFGPGSFISIHSAAIGSAPPGVYLISTNILVTNTILTAGELRVRINGVTNLMGSDTRFDCPSGGILASGGAVTGIYTHAGGTLTVTVSVNVAGGTATVLDDTSITIAKI